jgi:hypothetical protein
MGMNPKASGRVRYLVLAAVGAVLAAYLVASAVAHVFPFSSGTSSSRPGQNGQLLLLLPGDLPQHRHGCRNAQPPGQWSAPGLVQALHCTDQGLAGGNVYAYQLDSAADFQAAWRSFNRWWGFRPGEAGSACPPNGAARGVMSSHGAASSPAVRQLTECGMMVSGNDHVPAYAWDLPRSDAFVIAQGAPGSSFSALASWLTGPPATALTPALGPHLAAGVAPLSRLLPSGVADLAANCTPLDAPWNWALPGLVQDLSCTDPNLPGGQIYAFQLDSTVNFLTSWQNFNKWWGFDITRAGPHCPPGGSTSRGIHGWSARDFPARSGQVLECGMVGSGSSAAPAYAYAMPAEDAFFVAQDTDGSPFTTLSNWWSGESMPAAPPRPASS